MKKKKMRLGSSNTNNNNRIITQDHFSVQRIVIDEVVLTKN